jgi:hypothetical protein
MKSWHVAVAAEAIAAAEFARCEYDVSVQYGADQPEYDLIVAMGPAMLKVSVKGSQNGSWGLTQSYLENADYHAAAEAWLSKHKPGTIVCFVQFKNKGLLDMPSIYLATPKEVAQRLKQTANGGGDTILYEEHEWTDRARGAGSTDRIPAEWMFSKERIEELAAEA